ncbi:MAG: lycopene beta-cyclase CrtY [Bdellovibrionaceae bacterium]|nr:lycopene beta-cyclase CrtY [Pseudobdellovibrionaceae bacterium]
MSQIPKKFDWVIVGGGLAGKLAAYFLCRLRPTWSVALIEKNHGWSIHHTWSCFETDVPSTLKGKWEDLNPYFWSKHKVYFPQFERTLDIGYYSLREQDLNQVITNTPNLTTFLGYQALTSSQSQKSLNVLFTKSEEPLMLQLQSSDGQGAPLTIESLKLVLATGWPPISGPVGYQKFVGWEVRTTDEHGLEFPVLMDARVPQTDGYRFFYVLPFTKNTLLIEDTYYSDSSHLSEDLIAPNIYKYASQNGWKIADVLYRETGVLPIPLFKSSFNVSYNFDFRIVSLGTCAGHFHPVTGYSLPVFLKQWALFEQKLQDGGISVRKKMLPCFSRADWGYRMLNRFMWYGATSQNRRVFFAFFYQKKAQGLICRFYSHNMSLRDWLSFYASWPPPISLTFALRAMLKSVALWMVRCWRSVLA